MTPGQQLLANGLERLLNLPLQPGEALKLWYAEARKLDEAMRQFPEVEIPHNIRHFLIDADIRSKPNEGKYRESQERQAREFIDELRRLQHAS